MSRASLSWSSRLQFVWQNGRTSHAKQLASFFRPGLLSKESHA